MDTVKVVIAPTGAHGFGLSDKARERLVELGVEKPMRCCFYDNSKRSSGRDDPRLVQVVEELGQKACGPKCVELVVVEVPADARWRIDTQGAGMYAERITADNRVWLGNGSMFRNVYGGTKESVVSSQAGFEEACDGKKCSLTCGGVEFLSIVCFPPYCDKPCCDEGRIREYIICCRCKYLSLRNMRELSHDYTPDCPCMHCVEKHRIELLEKVRDA